MNLIKYFAFIFLIQCASAGYTPREGRAKHPRRKDTALITLPTTPAHLNVGGLYVIHPNENEIPDSAYKNPHIDGVFLKYKWADLQPAQDRFDWAVLDAEFEKSILHHKKIEIAVAAGSETPAWVYNQGIPKLNFTEATRNYFKNCIQYDLPVFWHPTFVSLWQNFIVALGNHIASKPGFMDAITIVKLNGINSQSVEVKLPQQENVTAGKCETGDQRIQWSNAGYKPSHVIATWAVFASTMAQAFPKAYIGLALVMPNTSFPNVDELGRPTAVDSMLTHRELLSKAFELYPTRLVVNSTALREKGGTPPFVKEMNAKGAITGYQLFGQFINPECGKSRTCNENELTQAFKNGFAHGATFFEVFPRTLVDYPKSIAFAAEKFHSKR